MVKERDPQHDYIRSRRRRGAIGGLSALAAVGLLVTGWAAATTFQSPSQVAAASTPPPPSFITAGVEQGKLDRVITAQGEVASSRTDELILEASDSMSAVTDAPAVVGAAVNAGSVVAEINGDPVFLLPGAFPFYRDLHLGDRGPDVTALQAALAAAGFEVGSDGVLGAGTADAVRKLYSRNGYRAPTPSAETPTTPESVADGQSTSPQSEQPQPQPQQPPRLVFPLGAALVAPSLPAVVAEAPRVGRLPVEGARILLASGEAVVRVTVSPVTAGQLRIGMPARVVAQDGSSVALTVADVAVEAEEDGSVLVALAPSEPLTNPTGDTVVVEITLDPGIEESLIVPSLAVASRGDDAVVRRAAPDGSVTEVRVRELAESLGRSAIEPLQPGELRVGDEVLVHSALD